MKASKSSGLSDATIRALAEARDGGLALPGPLTGRQAHWKQCLPWCLKVEYRDNEMGVLRESLGIAAERDQRWELLEEALRQGVVLLRVIRLHPRYRVSPGETQAQQQARLDRWLPKPFFGDARSHSIGWSSAVRFASFFAARSIPSSTVHFLIGQAKFDAIWSQLRESGAVGQWGNAGRIYLLLTVEK
ncbi:MAG TPA: hypothetical protein VH253_05575 [Phycisphaerae bacterium]|nr:hypothetical protein [Phycisphaerae bacterium]